MNATKSTALGSLAICFGVSILGLFAFGVNDASAFFTAENCQYSGLQSNNTVVTLDCYNTTGVIEASGAYANFVSLTFTAPPTTPYGGEGAGVWTGIQNTLYNLGDCTFEYGNLLDYMKGINCPDAILQPPPVVNSGQNLYIPRTATGGLWYNFAYQDNEGNYWLNMDFRPMQDYWFYTLIITLIGIYLFFKIIRFFFKQFS